MNSRPTEAEAALEQLPTVPDGYEIAAQKVITHLRNYGPNARVVILAATFAALRGVCLDGPYGLFTLFPDDFGTRNVHLAQFNHTLGGQVIQHASTQGPHSVRTTIYTLIWAEFAGKMNDYDTEIVSAARKQLRTNDFVFSSGGIAEK